MPLEVEGVLVLRRGGPDLGMAGSHGRARSWSDLQRGEMAGRRACSSRGGVGSAARRVCCRPRSACGGTMGLAGPVLGHAGPAATAQRLVRGWARPPAW
jgi:hypothetical protein